MVASLLDGGAAHAQTAAILRGAAHLSTSTGVPAIATPSDPTVAPTTPAMTSASARAILNQANAAKAVSLAQQAQAAARASAAALNTTVPNGLGVGALNPVANPLKASADPTGISTWQGASLPTQTVSGGKYNVTVNQTDPLAVLSWTTFNVGQNTTLTFNQKLNGTAQPSWVALNRVVGQINPATGLRDPGTAPAPSQILGAIKADGEVLVLNPNGVIFGATAQVNTYSLGVSSLDIGRSLSQAAVNAPLTIQQRNEQFLTYGLLGYAEQASVNNQPSAYTFSAEAVSVTADDPTLEGAITIQAGAQITSANTGFLLFAAPKVINAGQLTSANGEVALLAGRQVLLQASDGSSSAVNTNVRGLAVSVFDRTSGDLDYVQNSASGLIQVPDGYIALASPATGAVIDQGALVSSTSVSRNGYIQLSGLDIQLAPGATLSITPDDSAGTIPQDTTSLSTFKASQIDIGSAQSRIEMDGGALIYAPNANVNIGASAGAATVDSSITPGTSRIFVDSGAVIDVAGLTNVVVPASRNSIAINPVTLNELADSPNYKSSFLNGATVYVDPRLSGVSANGVAWVGSPLIEAASYAQQVGVSASELMTKGGNVTLGVAAYTSNGKAQAVPDVIVKPGASIDISGGWVTYAAGLVKTTRLIDANGEVVDISNANPNDTYIGIYTGYTASHTRWGVSETYADPIQTGDHYEAAYTEGRDAGSLTIKSSAVALDGSIYANAFAGSQQILGAQAGTAASTRYGDGRLLQAAPSQLPSGGFLDIQAIGVDASGNPTGGADIELTNGATGTSTAGLTYGQSVTVNSNGALIVPTLDPAAALPTDRLDTISLSATALSNAGLSDLSLQTSGKITIDAGADLTLAAHGEFDAVAGRALTVDGSVTTASGRINLATAQLGSGSVFAPDTAGLGSFDLTVNGTLSTRGRWVNDYLAAGALQGSAYLNGGSISLTAAPSVSALSTTATLGGGGPATNTDISGSILIHSGALLDVSGGGYVSTTGALTLTSKGGNLSLTEATTYFQLNLDPTDPPGAIPGFRVSDIITQAGTAVVPVNPDKVNASVFIAPGTILADGFGGGGTFKLTTPQISLVASGSSALNAPVTGTALSLDFFNKAGFANYAITSYKTNLTANAFDNGLGGYNAVLQTQVVELAPGQSINLTQSGFSPLVDANQINALRNLSSGGDLYSVLTPGTPTDAWDQSPVKLTLGGLVELKIDAGASVVGAAGASLTVGQLDNLGLIRLPGGTLTQSEILPALYTESNAIGVSSLSELFSTDASGQFAEDGLNLAGLIGGTGSLLTNAEVAAQDPIYLLGDLAAGVGVRLAPGSVTDLSGTVVVNPRATVVGQGTFTPVIDGKVIAGGTLQTLSSQSTGQTLFATPLGVSIYTSENPQTVRLGGILSADTAVINVSGAVASFDRQAANGDYGYTPVWSDAGSISLGGGARLQGVTLKAQGGAAQAMGGTLVIPNLTLTQVDQAQAGLNTISASAIEAAGIATLVDQGTLTTQGDVSLNLGHAFFLTSGQYNGLNGQTLADVSTRDALTPTISATGDLQISAPYIAFDSSFQSVSTPIVGALAGHTATFTADAIDVVGAVRFDQSLAKVQLNASGDLRLIGASPWQQNFNIGASTVSNSLAGQLSVNGDLTLTAAQVYPTTGSSYILSSIGSDSTITFARAAGSDPAAPYSAGGSLWVQAAHIDQAGVVRAPLGALTLGSNSALKISSDGGKTSVAFAPATTSVTLESGSLTSVSASGLSIPYGVTTDQTEWYFSPTTSTPLTAPPAGVLKLSGQGVSVGAGATVDISGGGDVYAYEFIAGTGGSHDVLSQFNTNSLTGNGGYQYADHRQVYAIVPGLSSQVAAAYDPIYSANYGSLYSAAGVGSSVYLNGGPGVPAGWYTLLPAQYALLPGGMRVVQDTSATVLPPVSGQVLKDGTVVVSGEFGVAGTSVRGSSVLTFDVQSQSTFEKYSNIALTSGDANFAALAAHNGRVTPRLPIDAGRLVLDPVTSLTIQSSVDTTPAAGGRGGLIDVSGANLDIVTQASDATVPGAIVLTAAELTNLNAASLLIGGERTENSDGTTAIDVTAHDIRVENDASSPLSAPEVLLAVDGRLSKLVLAAGADITATGTADASQTGAFVLDGATSGMTGQGAFLRVANAPERLVKRENVNAKTLPGLLSTGNSVILKGTSTALESSGDLRVATTLKLTTTNLLLGASSILFSDNNSATPGGLNITPQLMNTLAGVKAVRLISPAPISLTDGGYTFNGLSIDAPGLVYVSPSAGGTGSGGVSLTASSLNLANSASIATACGLATSCDTANLRITAATITFGSGVLDTFGFGGQVTLAATQGVFGEGQGGLNVGSASLNLQTPFVGDQATPATVGSTTAAKVSLTLTSTGAVSVTNPSAASAGTVVGTPGASLEIDGASIAVSGSDLRATAGALTLKAAGNITIGAGARIETPGYSRQFGDTADAYTISAPGGVLNLKALGGNISLASGATLSVGGGTGQAGSLNLAASGAVTLNGALDASAPNGQASLTLDTGAGFDLSGFVRQWGSAFTGDVSIRTGTGDLTLASGQTLKAINLALTADGGRVDIAGDVNVSGAVGGDVSLYGAQGVTLESGALIDAHANGYAASDTRQATGGTVTLGTDGTGALRIAAGAVIDVAATRTSDRLVALSRDGATSYSFVKGDQGGGVLLRAPVIDDGAGVEDVNITVAGTVQGASSVTVEAFKHYDLGAVAASGAYVGVTQTGSGQITLDTAAQGGAPNFLTDNAAGTLVNFIQGFDLSAANAKLGGLTKLSGYSAQPGVELDYSGAITLASNWNLGAGTVDVAGAVAAGLMAPIPNLPGKYYVLPGDGGAVFSRFTHLTYRVGGAVDGAPGVLTLRAGGDLTLNGSITDGFFTFADQTDPDYLNLALGGGNRVYQGYLTPFCAASGCTDVSAFSAGVTPTDVVNLLFPQATGLSSAFSNPIPYSAAANSPSALGGLTDGAGDPIGSAQLFPLISRNGASQVVQSWSYQLVGGAAASANPLQTTTGASGDVVVQGFHPYAYQATTAVSSFNSTLDLVAGSQIVAPSAWLAAMEKANPSLSDSAYTVIDFSTAPGAARTVLSQDALTYFKALTGADSSQYVFTGSATRPTGVATTLKLAADFLSSSSFNFSAISANYRTPTSAAHTRTVNAIAPTLVRTGTGSIAIAASTNVDLRNGASATYLSAAGAASTQAKGGLQVGGVAIYTAGHVADTSLLDTVDSVSGDAVSLDVSGSGSAADLLANPVQQNYSYGGATGYSSILIANPVYATGGGDLTVSAGQDVLGRRDVWLESRLGDNGGGAAFGYSWIGNGDQAWRTGEVGAATDIRINPQLFQEGLGALGGGNISVTAGRNISDLSVVDTTSVATAQVTASSAPTLSGQALVTYGGGDVSLTAVGDLLGGRLDVGSGVASISVGGDIASAGQVPAIGLGSQQMADTLRLRLSDATVTIAAGGGAALQGITALGVRGLDADIQGNLDSMGFYSADAGVSIIANDAISIANTGISLLTQNSPANSAVSTAVYPGSLQAASLNGDLTIATPNVFGSANAVVLYPSPKGELTLAAAGDIAASTIDMEDSDPNQLPGVLTNFRADVVSVLSGHGFAFPNIQPNTNATVLASLHDATPVHTGDLTPNRIYAGRDINDLILSTPKQTRIGAGRDIINMVFVGQNLLTSDITRIVAGRDILATTILTQPVISADGTVGQELPTLQGNSFVIGGPGSFFLEAGRDAGPFLNSAVTNGYVDNLGHFSSAGTLTYGGGILSVGDEWNPWLAQQGASIYTEFGVSKGQNFDALREAYLDPANLSAMPDYLFAQTTNAAGISVADRSQPIYGPILIAWIKANTNAFAADQTITYQQAYDVFVSLPKLQQETFLLKNVYFNELEATSIPTSVSYHQYSRGYQVVNTLFPASYGYTQNDLAGGSNGANSTVTTGNLDLRLATIQTDQGGDIVILGPGGRVLAGSTVATATQASQRAYEGGLLFSGNALYSGSAVGVPLPSSISSIPVGDEGILALRSGSIYAFTDKDFLLNQSRLFTEGGGNIVMWTSNGDLNAGQGQKTTADVPPVVVTVDQNAYSQVNQDAAVSGAGIGAFVSDPNATPPDVFLIAPRGTVDAGAAGIRVAGNLFIAANSVANASNIQVGGTSSGISVSTGPSIGAQTGAGATAAAAAQSAQSVSRGAGPAPSPSVITVIPVGAASDSCPPDDKTCRR